MKADKFYTYLLIDPITENFNIERGVYSSETYENKVGTFEYKDVLSDWSKKKVLEMYILQKTNITLLK